MTGSIVWRLVAKDLYFLRWFVVGAIVAGVGALAVMPQGRVPAYVGGVSLICTLIVLLIFVVMGGVAQERKDKVLLFVLSLPVSTTQYLAAKVIANAIAFGVPWSILTLATLVVVERSGLPNGVIPFWSAVLGYMFFYYCALLGVSLLTDSTGWHAVAITIGNLSVNFLIPFLLSRPTVRQTIDGPVAVWSPDVATIVALEFAVGIAVLGAALVARSRQRDFV
jgi:hypothetical protein